MREFIARYAPPIIIFAALAVSAPRLASALSFVEPPFLGFRIEMITGPAFGVTTAGATVYIWHVYQERKRLKLAPVLLIGWCILLALIALILVPGMVLEVRAGPLADSLIPPFDILWCIALALSSEVVVGLAALASAIAKQEQKKEKQEPAQVTVEQPQSEKDNGREPALCPFCERSFGSVQAVSAHLRFCEAKEQVSV